MSSQRNVLLKALLAHAAGEIEMSRANIEVYLNASVGIWEHSNITGAMQEEIDKIAKYQDQIDVINRYFKGW